MKVVILGPGPTGPARNCRPVMMFDINQPPFIRTGRQIIFHSSQITGHGEKLVDQQCGAPQRVRLAGIETAFFPSTLSASGAKPTYHRNPHCLITSWPSYATASRVQAIPPNGNAFQFQTLP